MRCGPAPAAFPELKRKRKTRKKGEKNPPPLTIKL